MIGDEGSGESQVRFIFLRISSFAEIQCHDSLNPLVFVKEGRSRLVGNVPPKS